MILNAGTLVGDRYEIKEKLGSGGMAIVYKAMDTKLDRDVTFKVMREEHITDEEFVKRFYIEARAAAKLSHQNIVRVHDVGQEGSIYYLVMEYIDGFTLKELIEKRGPFDDKETLGVAIQIASALEHSHKSNIIHRDIKPQNILVTNAGTVKVTDFGIARAASENTLAATTSTMGSVHYFSPEQARGRFVDARSDLYSLGIIMYEMATGRLPFDDETPVAVALKHLNDPLPSARIYNEKITESLEKIILKSTAKVTAERYESAELMGNDLKRALTNSSGSFVKMASADDLQKTVILSNTDAAILRKTTKPDHPTVDDFFAQDGNSEPEGEFDEADEVVIDKKTERNVKIAAVVTAFAIISLLAAIAVNFYLKGIPNPISVPNLEGQDFDEAQRMLDDLGLVLALGGSDPSSEYAKNVITKQDYIEGDQLIAGATITVLVSLGAEQTEVPYVVGKHVNDIVVEFQERRVSMEELTEYSETVPRGEVIRQNPRGGSIVDVGTVVSVFVSFGSEHSAMEVPNVVDLTEEQARTKIEEAGFVVGAVTKATSQVTDEGRIITQLVEAGNHVEGGTAIGLIVSSGLPTAAPPPIRPPAGTNSPAPTSNEETETPTETPTETETPADAASSTDTTPSASETRTLEINPPLADDAEDVHLVINKRTVDGTSVMHERVYHASEFPISIPVSDTGRVEYQLMIDGRLIGSQFENFGE